MVLLGLCMCGLCLGLLHNLEKISDQIKPNNTANLNDDKDESLGLQ